MVQRRIQIGLALFYLSINNTSFATAIAEDYLDILHILMKKLLKLLLILNVFYYQFSRPPFGKILIEGTLIFTLLQKKIK